MSPPWFASRFLLLLHRSRKKSYQFRRSRQKIFVFGVTLLLSFEAYPYPPIRPAITQMLWTKMAKNNLKQWSVSPNVMHHVDRESFHSILDFIGSFLCVVDVSCW